jgi:hypothetical protein
MSSLNWTVDKEVGEGEDEKYVLDSTQMAALLVFVQRAWSICSLCMRTLTRLQVPFDISVRKTVHRKLVPTVSLAVQTRKTDSEPMTRAGESEEASGTDRKARLRIGAQYSAIIVYY